MGTTHHLCRHLPGNPFEGENLSNHFGSQPRVYTRAFGRRVASLLPHFNAGVKPLRSPQDLGSVASPNLVLLRYICLWGLSPSVFNLGPLLTISSTVPILFNNILVYTCHLSYIKLHAPPYRILVVHRGQLFSNHW